MDEIKEISFSEFESFHQKLAEGEITSIDEDHAGNSINGERYFLVTINKHVQYYCFYPVQQYRRSEIFLGSEPVFRSGRL